MYFGFSLSFGKRMSCVLNPGGGALIVMTTTSTSATWSPTTVTKTGETLVWTAYQTNAQGEVLDTVTANDPTLDLSGNTGTAYITVESADGWAGLTVLDIGTKSLTSCVLPKSELSNLTTLDLYANHSLVADLEDLVGGLNSLEILELPGSGMSGDLSVLSGFTNLVRLHMASSGANYTGGLSDLSSLTAMEDLNVSFWHDEADDISNLSGMSSLRILQLQGSNTTGDIGSLPASLQAGYLNSIANLSGSGISSLTGLSYLDIRDGDFSSTDIDQLFADLVAAGRSSGTFKYSGNEARTAASDADAATMVSRGWTLDPVELPADAPLYYDDVLAWWRPEDIVNSGGVVALWPDIKSGNELVQANTSYKPQYSSSALAGKPGLICVSSDRLTCSTLSRNQPYSVFMIACADSWSDIGRNIFSIAGGISGIITFTGTPKFHVYLTSMTPGINFTLGNWYIWTLVANGLNTFFEQGVGDFSLGPYSVGTSSISSGFTIGGQSAGNGVNSKWCEVIVYNRALNSAETDAVQQQLRDKYGV